MALAGHVGAPCGLLVGDTRPLRHSNNSLARGDVRSGEGLAKVMLLSAPGVALAAILLTAPGVLWALYCYPSGSYATRVAVGLALGLAFQWHVCALLAVGP